MTDEDRKQLHSRRRFLLAAGSAAGPAALDLSAQAAALAPSDETTLALVLRAWAPAGRQ